VCESLEMKICSFVAIDALVTASANVGTPLGDVPYSCWCQSCGLTHWSAWGTGTRVGRRRTLNCCRIRGHGSSRPPPCRAPERGGACGGGAGKIACYIFQERGKEHGFANGSDKVNTQHKRVRTFALSFVFIELKNLRYCWMPWFCLMACFVLALTVAARVTGRRTMTALHLLRCCLLALHAWF